MKKGALFILFFTAIFSFAQKTDLAQKYSAYIDSSDLKKHLTVLASDAYEGRETGKKGQQMAASYLIQSFQASGCKVAPGMTGYEQYFDVIETEPGGELTIANATLTFKKDFIYYGAKRKFQLNNTPLYTIDGAKKQKGPYVLVHQLTGNDMRVKVTQLKKDAPNGYVAIVLVVTNYSELYEYLEHYTTNKSMRLAEDNPKAEIPIIVVNSNALKGVFEKKFAYLLKNGKTKKVTGTVVKGTKQLTCDLNKDEQKLRSSNILAFIPGSDPILSNEVVIITAHYDHIGIDNGVVYNGADDDGTGTVALLEIAQAFMMAQKEGNAPRRSILIMPVSGEEKGLLGSLYYSNHPIIPLANAITDLNIDMIGRDDIAHEGKSNYIYIIGSDMISTDLHKANELANSTYTKLTLDYTFNNKTDPNQFYYRSDHYNFAKNEIPSIFYFSGVHDDYHQPTDDVAKINFQKVEKVARLVFHTAWILANETKRPAPNY
jgi:hypothetical protein